MPAVPLSSVAIHLRPTDNIAVAARPIPGGTEVELDGRPITLPGPRAQNPKASIGTPRAFSHALRKS